MVSDRNKKKKENFRNEAIAMGIEERKSILKRRKEDEDLYWIWRVIIVLNASRNVIYVLIIPCIN